MDERLPIENKRKYRHYLLPFIILIIIADRFLWASLSQWREDQATNIWLGFTQHLDKIPVGLISSVGLPNPNGMIILGFLLSKLPNLWFVSALLGCMQATLILCICWFSFNGSNKNLFLMAAPLLTSILLRASSVEFWNQWLMTLINLSFLLWAVLYLRKPSLYKIPALIGLVIFSPALYLAGLVNAIVIGALGVVLIWRKPPKNWENSWWKSGVFSLVVVALFIWLIWLPYFKVVKPNDLLAIGSNSPVTVKILLAIETIVKFPIWGTVQWFRPTSFAILENSKQILSKPTTLLVDLILLIHFVQAALAVGLLILGLVYKFIKPEKVRDSLKVGDSNAARLVSISIIFLIASYAMSPLLGGPTWSMNERIDQTIQFLPFFIIFWFLTPLAIPLPERVKKIISTITISLVAIYSGINTLGGVMIVDSYLNYRGNLLTEADIPLMQKMQAVDFIARDWMSISTNKEVPVDYQLGGGIWNWVPEFGNHYLAWYPAPFTLGRGFDYDLLRRYGLKNSQEGVQIRSYGTGRYLVNYAFEPPPISEGGSSRYYIFGRLRVTVNSK